MSTSFFVMPWLSTFSCLPACHHVIGACRCEIPSCYVLYCLYLLVPDSISTCRSQITPLVIFSCHALLTTFVCTPSLKSTWRLHFPSFTADPSTHLPSCLWLLNAQCTLVSRSLGSTPQLPSQVSAPAPHLPMHCVHSITSHVSLPVTYLQLGACPHAVLRARLHVTLLRNHWRVPYQCAHYFRRVSPFLSRWYLSLHGVSWIVFLQQVLRKADAWRSHRLLDSTHAR